MNKSLLAKSVDKITAINMCEHDYVADAVMKGIYKACTKPFNFRVRDGFVCTKGKSKISCKDLTSFWVQTESGPIKGRPNEFYATPVWGTRVVPEDTKGHVIDMSPLINYGIPIVYRNTASLMDVDDQCTRLGLDLGFHDESTRLNRALIAEYQTGYLSESEVLFRNSLMTAMPFDIQTIRAIEMSLLCQRLQSPATYCGSILNLLNENPILLCSVCYKMTLDAPEDILWALFEKNFSYEDKHVSKDREVYCTNMEIVCYAITVIWISELLTYMTNDSTFVGNDVLINLRKELCGLIAYALGDDVAGTYIRSNVNTEDDMLKYKGMNYTRTDFDHMHLFNKIYKANTRVGVDNSLYMYDQCTLGILDMFSSAANYCYNRYMENERSLDDIRNSANKVLSNSKCLSKRVAELEKENESIKALNDAKQEELNNTVSLYERKIERLTDELEFFKTKENSYYSDDTNDEGCIQVDQGQSLEECIANIQDYSILIVGGRDDFLNKLYSYGLSNVEQAETTTTTLRQSYDFYCISTKFVGHKLVKAIESKFNTKDVLFYFNGTNPDIFIRAANDFIMTVLNE